MRDAGLQDQIAVVSAGTGAWHVGELPDARTRSCARTHGIELTSRAQQFQPDDFAACDYIVAMDRQNREHLLAMTDADVTDKVFLLRNFDPNSPHDADVPDPYYAEAGFERVFELCHAGCRGLLEHIVSTHSLTSAS